MEKVSIIIPVYKSGKVVETVKKLQEDPYPNKEFIIYVNSPEESFLKELNKLENFPNVKTIVKKEREGKVTAVNKAVELSTGDILIFIDADAIPEKFDIEKVIEACKEYELVEFPKIEVPKNLIGKLMHIEYFGYFSILQKVSSKIKKSITLNGAGFAMRKDIWEKLDGYKKMILEDMDLATRLYIMGGRYHLLEDIIIKVESVSSWNKWFDQRKRWAYGGIEWFFTYPKTILSFFIKYPLWLLAYIIFINPAILLYFLLFLLPHNWLYNIALTILIILSTKFSPLLFFILPLTLIETIIKGFLLFIGTVLIFLIIHEVVYRTVWKRFVNPLWILGYVLIYSPLWLLIIISMILHYIIFERPPKIDWKI